VGLRRVRADMQMAYGGGRWDTTDHEWQRNNVYRIADASRHRLMASTCRDTAAMRPEKGLRSQSLRRSRRATPRSRRGSSRASTPV